MKKLIAIILLTCMSAATVTSCGNSDTVKSNTVETTIAQTEETEAQTTVSGDIPEIGVQDFNGSDFVINYIDWSLHKKFFFADSENGEAVNDAIYARTLKVEEDINAKIVPYNVSTQSADQFNSLKNSVMSGDNSYDLMLIHNSSTLGSYITGGLVMNWNKIPLINMDKDYWDQSIKTSFELDGMLPFADNDFVLPDVNSIFFNIELIKNYNLENPYSLVLDGKWTWDKLIELAEKVSADINGDGVFDDQDQYGFVGEFGWQFGSVPTSCGQYTVEIDEDGIPQLMVNNEKMINLVEKINKLIKANNTSYTWAYDNKYDPNAGGTPPVSFDSGKALFYLVPLSLASTFRETDVEFGIVPLPKNDESQEDYITLNWAGLLCVPMNVKNPELVGAASELLAYYNREIVVPPFYDILLGQKIARDDDSRKMLDIIFSDNVHDLGINLGSAYYCILVNVIKDAKGDFASYYAGKENALKGDIDKFYQACVEYNETYG